MILAVIDMGTNTFNLLISRIDDGFQEVLYEEIFPVRIGKNGISNGYLTNDAFERALNTIGYYHQKIVSFGVEKVLAYATSAVRNAKNGTELTSKIKELYDIEVNVIDGNTEAELIFYGVLSAVKLDHTPFLIMDIGGGSVEFIIGRESHILWKQSFEIGAQRMFDFFHRQDPISQENINAMFGYLHEKLSPLLNQVRTLQPQILIGAAGTFDTIFKIYSEQNGKSIPTMQNSEYYKICEMICSKNLEERKQIPGMVEMRAEMIAVASLLCDFVLRETELKTLRYSSGSLKEGVAFQQAMFSKIS